MRVLITFLLGLAGSLAFGWWGFPQLLYQRESQPLQYNHKIHIEKGSMECSSCHEVAADGQFAGIPRTASCGACHAEPLGNGSRENSRHELCGPGAGVGLEGVFAAANERAVLARGSCEQGSDEVRGMPWRGSATAAEPFYRNRVTGESRNVWGPRMIRVGLKPGEGMKMSDCESCHAQKGVSAGCLGCHR